MRLDVDAITRQVAAALPEATPDAVANLLRVQIPHIDAPTGISLVDRIAAQLPPSTWLFEDERLDRWPESVAARALVHVRALPRGQQRILALCRAAKRLTLAERREALDGILDGTLPTTTFEYTKPMSYRHAIAYLVRSLPEEWQDEWIASKSVGDDGKPDVGRECRARREIDRVPEAVVRALWARIDHTSSSARDVPLEYIGIISILPHDLRLQALKRIRASGSTRWLHLANFDEELTEAERIELIEGAWRSAIPGRALWRVREHLLRAPITRRHAWLEAVLSSDDELELPDLQSALLALLPCLPGEHQRRAADALIASVLREGCFYSTESRWDLLPDDALAPLLLRHKADPYGSRRDEVIEHVITAREPELADRCLQPLVGALPELAPDSCLEVVTAMTPWLAERSDGAVPRSLAALPVPRSSKQGNPLYAIARVIRETAHEQD